MGILNLTPDSFWEPSRAGEADALARIRAMAAAGASIIDIGAVSSRPGADEVSLEEERSRLEPVLRLIAAEGPQGMRYSVDTTRGEIAEMACGILGNSLIINDISAGEEDPEMLPLVGRLGLGYIAMHRRGNPRSMDSLCDYSSYATEKHPSGVIPALVSYFREFGERAAACGVKDWILDPGLGFAKTPEQCWEILENLPELKALGHPVLIGASRKRFTGGDNARAHALALKGGADILRLHIDI